MDLDLSLLPIDPGVSYSHSILECFRRRALFEAILRIEKEHGRDVPEDFVSYMSRDKKYEEPHYGSTLETPYGDRLKTISPSLLRPLENHEDVLDNPINRAVWAYLAQLPHDFRVALMWS